MKELKIFCRIAVIEGVSYLLLLVFAMPLKYLYDMPGPVKYLGWLHGILFILYCVFLLVVWIKLKWSFGKVLLAFFASLLPFATFILDRRIRKEYFPNQN